MFASEQTVNQEPAEHCNTNLELLSITQHCLASVSDELRHIRSKILAEPQYLAIDN